MVPRRVPRKKEALGGQWVEELPRLQMVGRKREKDDWTAPQWEEFVVKKNTGT